MSVLGLALTAEEVVPPASCIPQGLVWFATSSLAYCALPGPAPLCLDVSFYFLAPSGPMLAVIVLLCCVRILGF